MGTGDGGTPVKAAKEQAVVAVPPAAATAPTYPEWAAAFQAYYSSGAQPPPGYFPPSVASGPQPHPYMWGGSMMPPYGTPPPPPYGAMYPHGGMYAHPSMPQGAHPYTQYGMPSPGGPEAVVQPQAGGTDADTKGEGKEKNLLKRSKGSLSSLGVGSVKGSEGGKGASTNEAFSQSDSGSEGSSDGSEEDSTPNMLRKRSFEQMTMDGTYTSSGVPAAGTPSGQNATPPPPHMVGKVPQGGPTTSLGIGMGGMDYWSGSAPGIAAGKSKRTSATSTGIVPGTPGTPLMGPNRDGVPPELWLQDEREVKRQRRKQSNRESARRSRLRKQAECEELGTRVDTLTMENMALRSEVNHLSDECTKLKAENSSLLEQLAKARGERASERAEGALPKEQNSKNEEVRSPQGEGNGKVSEGSKSGSPRSGSASGSGSGGQKNSGRREDESYDSPGKFPPLDGGSRPEAVVAG
eukprot:TRINITY_DN465_c0_g1_i1.p1 TRINITY_DN465_c0_g1~~TRINITY_DN465_c0_g1_i1.p1  ORF type:complete len:465 (-),score=96.01 TRINITY_DN465_c0_g1_i1:391-1785(-)